MKSSTLLTLLIVCVSAGNLIASSEATKLITSYKVDENTVRVGIDKAFADEYLKEESFFVTYDKSIRLPESPFSISTIPFLTNVITIVWKSGKIYSIPEMDEQLFHGLNMVHAFVKRIYPNTSWDGELKPEKLVDNKPTVPLVDPTKEAALLFSGGVDSTSAAFELQKKGVKLLFITMRGQGDSMLNEERTELWKAQSGNSSNFAAKHGHEITQLASNYHRVLAHDKLAQLSPEVTNWRVDAVEDLGMFGMTAPILFSRGIQRCYMASSREWGYPYISIGNPLTDFFMRFGAVRLVCWQFGYSRADKIAYIIKRVEEDGLEPPTLHVCYRGVFPSCTLLECRKCLPTAFMLYCLGADPRKFGYKATGEELITLMKKYLTQEQPHITLWQLMKLREMLKKKEPSEELLWFFDADLTAHVSTSYITGKPNLSWSDLKDLAPEELVIPGVKKLVLVKQESK